MKKIFRILFVVGVTSTLLFSSLNTDVKSDANGEKYCYSPIKVQTKTA